MSAPHPLAPIPANATPDYDLVRAAISFISREWRDQPEVETIAEAVGVSAPELTQLFRRWAGLTPKAFLQAVTLDMPF